MIKKLMLVSAILFTIGCSKYVRYDSKNAQSLKEQSFKIEEIQFYNAHRVILWEKDTIRDDNSKRLVKNKGKIKTSKIYKTKTTTIESNLQVVATPDPNNANILYVQYDPKSKKVLKFMKLSEASQVVRDEFIRVYNLNSNRFKDELYYLIPKEIFPQTIEKEIYSDAGFWGNLLNPKQKNVYCGKIQLGNQERQMYFKNPTFLKISKNDRVKHVITNNKAKGVKIKD